MGFSVKSVDKFNNQAGYFHYNEKDKDRPLYTVLGIKTNRPDRIEKPYSLGQLLEAKSRLMGITGTIGEQDFIDSLILAMKETNVKSILIIFN